MKTDPVITTLHASLLLMGGIGIGVLLVVLGPDRALSGWYLDPSLLVLPLAFASITVSLLRPGTEGRHFWLSIGALCAVGPHLTTRPGMGPVELDFFASANIQATLLVGGSLVLLGIGVKALSLERDHPSASPLRPRLVPLAWGMVLLFTLGYRLSHHWFLHIPNEERSLMFRGVEVHHLNVGLVALIMVGYLRVWGMTGRLQWVGVFLYGLGAALYLDESVYISLAEVTDAAYAGPASTWGAAIAIALWVLASARPVRALP